MIATFLFWFAVYLMAGSVFCVTVVEGDCFRVASAIHGSAALVALILSRVLA